MISLLWCCGQPLTALKKILRGVNEETCRTEAAQAVQSIPAYVEASDLFIALVPEVKHQDLGLKHRFAWLVADSYIASG